MVQYPCNKETETHTRHKQRSSIKLLLLICRIQLILIRGSVSLSKSLQYSLDTFSSLIPLYPLKTALRACKHYLQLRVSIFTLRIFLLQITISLFKTLSYKTSKYSTSFATLQKLTIRVTFV